MNLHGTNLIFRKIHIVRIICATLYTKRFIHREPGNIQIMAWHR